MKKSELEKRINQITYEVCRVQIESDEILREIAYSFPHNRSVGYDFQDGRNNGTMKLFEMIHDLYTGGEDCVTEFDKIYDEVYARVTTDRKNGKSVGIND